MSKQGLLSSAAEDSSNLGKPGAEQVRAMQGKENELRMHITQSTAQTACQENRNSRQVKAKPGKEPDVGKGARC